MSRLLLVMILIGVLPPILAKTENWPGWRGPRGDGSSIDTNIPVGWNIKRKPSMENSATR